MRLQPLVEASLLEELAEFRKNRNCYDQTIAQAIHINNGFHVQEKSIAVFLSSAYNTAWKRELLLKLAEIIKYTTTLRILENLLSNRKF